MAKQGNPKKGRGPEPRNKTMREQAHRRLDQMMDLAEAGEEYGKFGVTVQFEAGQITRIPQSFERADKPASI